MGAGKSTIGRQLAQELDFQFYDIDKVIEERAGANIPWIFDVEGEQGFRLREQQVIAELVAEENSIIATGGGAVMREENRRVLRSQGFVIYLKTSVEQQLERTSKDKNRPLLQADDPRQVLTSLMEIRDPLYRESCDMIVHTDRRHPKGVVLDILEQLASKQLISS